jgi:hypothetical protein
VLELLWDLATWHAYAKLRLHSDSTIASFHKATRAFGDSLRKFVRVTCKAFETAELEKEHQKRIRQKNRKQKEKESGSGHGGTSNEPLDI